MIARGDLGVEVPIERIALIQKRVTRIANQHAKPVITATQMLESMTSHRLPTRAEATDVANAILDGTDAVMLSGESATGQFPVEAVEMLTKIATEVDTARRRVPVEELFEGVDLKGRLRSDHLVALSVEVAVAHDRPAAIVVDTLSGASARRIASLHLPVWTIAASSRESTCQHLQFSRGVIAVHVPNEPASWSDFAREQVRTRGLKGNRALLVAGPSAANPAANHRLEIVEL